MGGGWGAMVCSAWPTCGHFNPSVGGYKLTAVGYKKAGRTAKSYILQEAEATARNAKVAWCHANGLRVTDLQHDGIMVAGIEPGSELDVTAGMEAAATAACGFGVGVDIKQC